MSGAAPFFSGEVALTVICAWCSKILCSGSVRRGDGGIEVSPPRRNPDNDSAASGRSASDSAPEGAGPCDPGELSHYEILRAGGARHSHGICEPCAAVHFPQAMGAQRADAEMAEVSQ